MKMYRNFSIEQVADGVYAVLAGSNAGIIDLGGQTLVFDTLSNLASADELKQAAEELTGRPATYVVVSHAHADHFNGNKAFAGSVIVSSAVTRQAMSEDGEYLMGRMKASMMAEADGFREKAEAAETEEARKQHLAAVAEYEEFFETYPTGADLVLPDLTYEHSMSFQGTKRTAQVLAVGGAHSPCDAVLWLPEDRIVFAADLVIPGDNLLLLHAEPENWPSALDRIEALDADILVPGHRKVTTAKEGLAWSRQYLAEINRVIDEAVATGKTLEELDALEPPKGCRTGGFRANLRVLMERRLVRKQ